MVSLSIHGGNLSVLITLPTPFNTTLSPKTSFSPKPNSFSLITLSTPSPKRPRSLPPSASAAAAEALEIGGGGGGDAEKQVEEKERLGVVVKVMEKPRLVLRFIWMEKNIGVALDQVIPGHGTVPLSPYFCWPHKDAWEELKSRLEEKPWISKKRMIILLNQATDVINLWQQSGDATNL